MEKSKAKAKKPASKKPAKAGKSVSGNTPAKIARQKETCGALKGGVAAYFHTDRCFLKKTFDKNAKMASKGAKKPVFSEGKSTPTKAARKKEKCGALKGGVRAYYYSDACILKQRHAL